MEFFRHGKKGSIEGWFAWSFSVGGYVRLQKNNLQIQLNLVFVEFYLDLYLLRKGSR